jgi:hypothetical protein
MVASLPHINIGEVKRQIPCSDGPIWPLTSVGGVPLGMPLGLEEKSTSLFNKKRLSLLFIEMHKKNYMDIGSPLSSTHMGTSLLLPPLP